MARNPVKRSCSSYGPENVTSVGETSIDQDVVSFLWTIKDWSAMARLKVVTSPVFRGGPKNNYGWILTLRKNEDDWSLSLGLSEDGEDDTDSKDESGVKVDARYQLTLLNADGLPDESQQIFRKSDSLMGRRFFRPSDLTNPKLKLVVDDRVKILCKIWIFGGLKQKLRKVSVSPSHVKRVRMSKDGLSKDLGKMFRESIATDVTISTSKAQFKAHKAILIARSSVFAAMFNNDMLEKHGNLVEITDFNDEVVEGMLEYLYTGETDCMTARAFELLQIAEKYDLTGLKTDCEFVMAEKLSVENAAEILILAQTHGAAFLKSRAMDFINLNKEKLLKNKSFRDAVQPLAESGALADLYFSQ